MNGYQHLGLDERRDIYRLVATGRSVRQIADALRRHSSTIYRELKRNRHLDEHPLFRGYFPTVAQTMARGRRVRGGKIARQPELAAYIADRLSAAWSPEQIAGYLRRHRGVREAVCHETIYQYVYGPDGRHQKLWRRLPVARRSRRQRYGRKPRGLHIPVANTIGARPQEIADRSSFGHWEGDLLIFRREYGKTKLTSLVERCSRFTFLARNPTRHSAGVMAGIDRHLRGMPPPPAQHHLRSRHGICRLCDTAKQARHHQLFLPAVSTLAERRRRKLQWQNTAFPALRYRHCAPFGQRDPGRCRSPQHHTPQVPWLPHSARSPGRADHPAQGRINFAIRGGARPIPDEMLRITSGVALQIETANAHRRSRRVRVAFAVRFKHQLHSARNRKSRKRASPGPAA